MGLINSNFYKTPFKIYSLKLNSKELLVLGFLFSLADNKTIHPSKKTIALKIGISRKTVDIAVRSLVKKGYLEYDRGFSKDGKNVCNRYRICADKIDTVDFFLNSL